MNEEQLLIVETTARVFSDHCHPLTVDEAESGIFAAELWKTLDETGLTLAGISEMVCGSGGGIEDALLIMREVGRFAAPIPLAENFIANWLISHARGDHQLEKSLDIRTIEGPLTLAQGDFDIDGKGRLRGAANQVAFARWAKNLLLTATREGERVLCLVPVESLKVEHANNMAGEPRDRVSVESALDNYQAMETSPDIDHRIRILGALSRATMMAGALESLLELSVQYALERQQFGRPIARFQAVQQQLAIVAGEVAASIRAADAVIESASAMDELEIAVAKSRIGDAVGISSDIAHQVHGAMGYTMEHVLNHRTRRLWCWREEYGNERYWQQMLGAQVVRGGADNLWQTMTSRA